MNKIISALAIIFCSLYGVAFGAETGTEGHGGAVIICPPGHKHSTMMLDVWEATRELKLKVESSDEDMNLQFKKILKKIKSLPRFHNDLIHHYRIAQKKMTFLPEDEYLAMTKDFNLHSIPRGCTLGQVATWPTDGMLEVDRMIYDQFNNSGKVAFLLHEAVYHYFRDADPWLTSNSDTARKLVAYLLATSEGPVDEIVANLLPGRRVEPGVDPGKNEETKEVKIGMNGLLAAWVDPLAKTPVNLIITLSEEMDFNSVVGLDYEETPEHYRVFNNFFAREKFAAKKFTSRIQTFRVGERGADAKYSVANFGIKIPTGIKGVIRLELKQGDTLISKAIIDLEANKDDHRNFHNITDNKAEEIFQITYFIR